MERFKEDYYYRPSDEAMRRLASIGTLAIWRYQGKPPRWSKISNKIFYRGSDLNQWIDQNTVELRPKKGV